MPRGPRILLLGSAVVMALMILIDLIKPPTGQERLQALRVELRASRQAADSCRAALAREEADLRAGDARLDSLRAEIAAYEALDPRGVPAESYEAYIAVFEAYNEGIPTREAVVDTIKIHWEACRDITQRHNELADSARALAAELGVLDRAPTRRVPADGTDADAKPTGERAGVR